MLRYSYNTCVITNCSNNQFTTISLWVFMYIHVCVKHVKVSAVKNKYYIKNTAAAGGKVYNSRCLVRLCIYFLYCTEKFTIIWLRWPQQDFKMPPNIRLYRHPHCPNSCKILFQTSSVLTCRNCTVCETMFMMLYAGHFITDNTCNNFITNLS